ncbi:MAG TPA: hypothetical protein VHC98_00315 [Candidatus Saccharimonadales bacterium]|nr:hypothetical protein [Candidatus Saccharimonadales bacterium]
MAGLFSNHHHKVDPVWHVQAIMLVAIGLQLALPEKFSAGTHYAIPALEALLLLALSFTTPRERVFRSLARRVNVFILIAVTSAANAYSLAVVITQLLSGTHASVNGRELIVAALNIYLTNVIAFALWYWEMDGGGPGERQRIAKYEQDFLFPQHQHESYKHPDWKPTFIDYLYVSATNAMAFSPTDTMPLSRRAKLLMLVQATVSLAAIALVAARAVNILR